jgi:hypothetical protein
MLLCLVSLSHRLSVSDLDPCLGSDVKAMRLGSADRTRRPWRPLKGPRMGLACDHATGKVHVDLMNENVNHLYFIHVRLGVVFCVQGKHGVVPSLGTLMAIFIRRGRNCRLRLTHLKTQPEAYRTMEVLHCIIRLGSRIRTLGRRSDVYTHLVTITKLCRLFASDILLHDVHSRDRHVLIFKLSFECRRT